MRSIAADLEQWHEQSARHILLHACQEGQPGMTTLHERCERVDKGGAKVGIRIADGESPRLLAAGAVPVPAFPVAETARLALARLPVP